MIWAWSESLGGTHIWIAKANLGKSLLWLPLLASIPAGLGVAALFLSLLNPMKNFRRAEMNFTAAGLNYLQLEAGWHFLCNPSYIKIMMTWPWSES